MNGMKVREETDNLNASKAESHPHKYVHIENVILVPLYK